MKALLLNSGLGSRMGDLTKDNPKCLVNLTDNETILSRQIDILQKVGVDEFIITIGPFGDIIPDYLKKMFPLLPVTYVRNEVYETTNYIYSMYLAKKYIEDDLLLLHGDIVLEEKVLKDIINSRQENLAIVDSTVPLPEKDFKCRIENEVIREIGIHLKKDNNEVLFLLPVYKLSLYFMTHWMKEIENFVHNKNTSVYAENAFNVISNNLNLLPFDIKGDFCMEVDTTIDLETAKKRLG